MTALIVLAAVYGYACFGSYTAGRVGANYGPDNPDAFSPMLWGGVFWPFTVAWWLGSRTVVAAYRAIAAIGPRALYERERARRMLPEARARYLLREKQP